MSQTKAPKSTPTPKTGHNKVIPKVGDKKPSTVFLVLALDITWRLAIVVLVPIIGGFELDQKLNSLPLLTIVGFIIAMIGAGLVMYRTLKITDSLPLKKVNHS